MPKHVIEEDLLLTLEDYVKRIENTPDRVVVTNSNGDIVVKQDLNVSQLNHLRNVTGDIQAQINEKSDVAHTHEEYLTLEEIKDINFSGVAEDVVYNPANSNLESTNVRDAIDEVDDKIEEYIEKLISDKAELKEDIHNTNKNVSSLEESVQDLLEDISNKADKDHTHEAFDHIHEDLNEAIANNREAIGDINKTLSTLEKEVSGLPDSYASINHTHQDLLDRMNAIDTDITDHKHTYLEEAIAQTNENVANNAERIQSHSESISNINKNITDLQQGKADIDHTHDASDHVHQDILDRIDGFNEDFAEVRENMGDINKGMSDINKRITDEAERVNNNFATKDHTHDMTDFEHNHDGVYAPVFHLHSNYADKEHYHNELYSPIDHSHHGEFAPVEHTHGDLANKEHTHKEFSDFVTVSQMNNSNGVATLDEHCKIRLSQIPDTLKAINIIGTQEERLALTFIELGSIFRETDSGDSYIYDGNEWIILSDADWANVKLQWSNIEGVPVEFNPIAHNHELIEINGLDEVLANKADINHTHEMQEVNGLDEALSNKANLDHSHLASEIYFDDGLSLQEKVDNNQIGGGGGTSSGGGDCNVIISAETPTNLPIGGIWIDISNL